MVKSGVKPVSALLAVCIFLVILAGCGGKTSGAASPPENKKPEAGDQINAAGKKTEKITLYFGDNQAMYLVPEEREIVKGSATMEEAVVRELISGPRKANLNGTIPEGTRLLSLSVKDGLATVNFSRDFKEKHPKGSAGETMTIYSVVNSLAKQKGVNKVQFLVEGETQESILGHIDTGRPVEPNWQLVSSNE